MPCTTVTVEAQDESEISITGVTASVTGNGSEVTVQWTAANNIVSGNGSDADVTFAISVGGNSHSPTETVPAGQTQSFTNTFTNADLSPGTYDACVEIQNIA